MGIIPIKNIIPQHQKNVNFYQYPAKKSLKIQHIPLLTKIHLFILITVIPRHNDICSKFTTK